MQEVLPDIFYMRLPTLGFPPHHANSYLIREGKGYTLVDTGWDTQDIMDCLEKELRELKIGFRDISRILLTHPHTDHAGLAGELRRLYGTPIYLHQDGIAALKHRFEPAADVYTDTFIRKTDALLKEHGASAEVLGIAEKILPDMPYPPFPDVTLHGGETITAGDYMFEIIYSPGHCPGHITFYDRRKQLIISGDNVLPTLTTNLGFHLQLVDNPLGDYLSSLQVLKTIDIRTVLPGHETAFSDLPHRIDELVQKHQKKSNNILRSLSDGTPRTACEVSQAVSWSASKNRSTWLDFTSWDKRFTMLENIVHLRRLAAGGKLEKSVRNGIIYYGITK